MHEHTVIYITCRFSLIFEPHLHPGSETLITSFLQTYQGRHGKAATQYRTTTHLYSDENMALLSLGMFFSWFSAWHPFSVLPKGQPTLSTRVSTFS